MKLLRKNRILVDYILFTSKQITKIKYLTEISTKSFVHSSHKNLLILTIISLYTITH